MPSKTYVKRTTKSFNLLFCGKEKSGKTQLIQSINKALGNIYPLDQNSQPILDSIEPFLKPQTEPPHFEYPTIQTVLNQPTHSIILSFIEFPDQNHYQTNKSAEITETIHKQFQSTLIQESKIKRSRVQDVKLHCIVYILDATECIKTEGVSFKDMESIESISSFNLVLIFNKWDQLTKREILSLEELVNDLKSRFPVFCLFNGELNDDGFMTNQRVYDVGISRVETSDFSRFVGFLFDGGYMQDLIIRTEDLYELWRERELVRLNRAVKNLSVLSVGDGTRRMVSVEEAFQSLKTN